MNYFLRKILFYFPRLLPDKKFLECVYALRTGKKLDFEHPATFTEKMQYLKLYERNPLFTKLVDKAEAKKYAAGIIGDDHVIPTLGIYKSVKDINWDELPEKFVIKCTHDSGSVIVCRNKNGFDRVKAEKELQKCLKRNFYYMNREYPYKDVKPRIICEAYMEDERQSAGLVDYKFFCFNGKPEFLYVSSGLENHATASISFCDLEGKMLPFRRKDYKAFDEVALPLPSDLPGMREYAQKLAAGVDAVFLRIDLYEINDKIYFSEFTFFPNSGYIPFEPEEWDKRTGDLIRLHNE